MSYTNNNGGPAFPIPDNAERGGMSLRDYFAGQAMLGIIAHESAADAGQTHIVNKDCQRAYIYADAMITAREVAK